MKDPLRQSDTVTTITSVTFISVTLILGIYLKNKTPPLLDTFGTDLMLFSILLFTFSAFRSYVDISIASYENVKEALNIKLFTYFGGLIVILIFIAYSMIFAK